MITADELMTHLLTTLQQQKMAKVELELNLMGLMQPTQSHLSLSNERIYLDKYKLAFDEYLRLDQRQILKK